MDLKKLLSRLNWFYSLEVTQVDNYLAQSKAVDDPYIAAGLERIALLEQEHVNNLSGIIISLGAKPSIISDILSPLFGTAMGKVLGTTDVALMLQTNIKIEAKAATDYYKLIRELESGNYDQGMLRTLQYNMVDEDFHSSWFAHVLERPDNRSWPMSPVLAGQLGHSSPNEIEIPSPS
ncbi:MAG: ferritin-like domain-containing protein [Bacillota bacterium]